MLRPIAARETLGRVDALEWQEPGLPTSIEEIQIKAPDGTRITRERVRRRFVDAQLWDAMTPVQQQAAERIAAGFKVVTSGLGARGQNFAAVRGRSTSLDAGEQLLIDYRNWANACAPGAATIALEILISGRSCRSVDGSIHKKNGTAKKVLFGALDAMVLLKRW